MIKTNNKYSRLFMQAIATCLGFCLYFTIGARSALASTVDRPFFGSAALVSVLATDDIRENAGTAFFASEVYRLDDALSG